MNTTLALADSLFETLLAGDAPRASSFIVTVYGDIVEPRGGVLWMGTLIEICAAVGINESLVRTAVSRLVAGGHLVGERVGRRSYYRLTPGAQVDFAAAAARIFAPQYPQAEGWLWVADDIPALARAGFATIAPGLMLGPDRAGLALGKAAVWRANLVQGQAAQFAAKHWPLGLHAGRYHDFVARFSRLGPDLPPDLQPDQALIARLLMIHDYRLALLHDPALPGRALPDDWPGPSAQRLFASLYARLTPPAEAHIRRAFVNDTGLMPAQTAATMQRLVQLSG